eukprot:TRINITY_DN17956_c0_g1_i4.p1 TRINITY_DN17956_c0_g1~~TRINITY_DN17956_c0_g1_i4.p1  ORF type:complete len:246 (-),score=78.18 TRINITY_DN17956_c0_g1_i4:315-1052(-)
MAEQQRVHAALRASSEQAEALARLTPNTEQEEAQALRQAVGASLEVEFALTDALTRQLENARAAASEVAGDAEDDSFESVALTDIWEASSEQAEALARLTPNTEQEEAKAAVGASLEVEFALTDALTRQLENARAAASEVAGDAEDDSFESVALTDIWEGGAAVVEESIATVASLDREVAAAERQVEAAQLVLGNHGKLHDKVSQRHGKVSHGHGVSQPESPLSPNIRYPHRRVARSPAGCSRGD